VLLVLFRIAQRRQRVGGLPRLGNEDGEITGFKRRAAIAEFRGDIDLDRSM
jgi:hypothetical protein